MMLNEKNKINTFLYYDENIFSGYASLCILMEYIGIIPMYSDDWWVMYQSDIFFFLYKSRTYKSYFIVGPFFPFLRKYYKMIGEKEHYDTLLAYR